MSTALEISAHELGETVTCAWDGCAQVAGRLHPSDKLGKWCAEHRSAELARRAAVRRENGNSPRGRPRLTNVADRAHDVLIASRDLDRAQAAVVRADERRQASLTAWKQAVAALLAEAQSAGLGS